MQRLKHLIPQPLASTRAKCDYVQPLHQGNADRPIVDAKALAVFRPLSDSNNGVPFLQATGQSTRIGYRHLANGGSAFWGLSGGYDRLWQRGS